MPATQARVAKRAASPAKRTTTNGRAKAKPTEPESDIEVLSRDEAAETFEARLFGDDDAVFTFYEDANFFLLLISYGGEGEDLAKLPTIIKSLMFVEGDTDEDRREPWTRFIAVLAKQRGMNAERTMRFINDLIAAAGKDQQESADD